ncbi:AraC family transcriptional regulator [Flavivirga aquimarina]|uniref:AraC family transcriptional regulator n=1 Tax=Flavivirga aquimarina TaxID=2027862 RepID=A0ABT8WCY7_9FLAO|nr:AraC family transcriptional regulator [Flavivirga aquimarina]MDO5970887.1 AraC family transcriptional regulator [Flavivirga aquimarina]
MKKKRREATSMEEVDLSVLKTDLKSIIAKEVYNSHDKALRCLEYSLLPKYGKGNITEFHFNNIVISISNYILNEDLMVFFKDEKNKLQLSFLLGGEKVMSIKGNLDKIPYETQESYMAFIETYNGNSKIFGKKPYKEIKITVSKLFLSQHGIIDSVDFKNLTDRNLIIPITDDLFSVLLELERKHLKGISYKIFLEAKVLEILAIQIENYKHLNAQKFYFTNKNTIKKLYDLKQFISCNLDKNYSNNQLSVEVGLNENELKNEFKRVFDCTVNQYFKSEKMKKAKHLLQNTESPIYLIAEAVGYKNATHFSAAFKRFYGEAPKDCRAKV